MMHEEKETIKETAENVASGAFGAGSTIGAISATGSVSGLSAAGITSGLATLGAGSMLAGVFVAGAIGYGGYRAAKWGFSKLSEEKTYRV